MNIAAATRRLVFELTQHLNWQGDNVLAVEVDSSERKDIPPFGNRIDYLTFGGIYRDVRIAFRAKRLYRKCFRKADRCSESGPKAGGSMLS